MAFPFFSRWQTSKENQETLGSLKIEVSAALQKCPTKEPKGKGNSHRLFRYVFCMPTYIFSCVHAHCENYAKSFWLA